MRLLVAKFGVLVRQRIVHTHRSTKGARLAPSRSNCKETSPLSVTFPREASTLIAFVSLKRPRMP